MRRTPHSGPCALALAHHTVLNIVERPSPIRNHASVLTKALRISYCRFRLRRRDQEKRFSCRGDPYSRPYTLRGSLFQVTSRDTPYEKYLLEMRQRENEWHGCTLDHLPHKQVFHFSKRVWKSGKPGKPPSFTGVCLPPSPLSAIVLLPFLSSLSFTSIHILSPLYDRPQSQKTRTSL